jgi:uncharacterized protein YaaR (DUF327 family)
MSDASVPLGLTDLEEIVEAVAHNLYNKWAIEDRFSEENMVEYAQHSVSDTVQVINDYMSLFNEKLMQQQATKIDLVVE